MAPLARGPIKSAASEPSAVRYSAGLVILRQLEGEWRCLVLRVFRNWDLPKGMPEAGEELLQTALREATEETGLIDLDMRWGKGYRDTAPYANGKVVRIFLAQSQHGAVRLPVNAALGRPEHHEFRWLSTSAAAQLLPARFASILKWVDDLLAD